MKLGGVIYMEEINVQEATPIDAIINISLSNDKLEASINIESPKDGGKEPDLEAIKSALESKGVTFGVVEKLLNDLAKKPTYSRDIVIAKGSEPVSGKDGEYEFLFKVNKDLKPREKDDGTVDFHNLDIVENVKRDQVLCTIVKPTDGINGMSVTGEVISSTPGKPIPNLLGKNTKYNDDETAILSTINGQVDIVSGKINVNETYVVNTNISNATGNVKSLGNVVINGAVEAGFIVEAKGNIEIGGNVSSATLKAGGNIILRSGVIGSKIHCEGDLTTRFVESSDVFVKGEIQASYIMTSQIKCGKSLKTVGSKSKIVGGSCMAGENIETSNLGSNAYVKTFIQIGTDSNNIARQQELTKEIPTLESKMDSLKSLISLLRQYKDANRLVGEKKSMYVDALYSYKEIERQLIYSKQELEEITETIKERGYGRVICRDTTYPGVTIRIGSYQTTIKEEMYRKSFFYTDEGINSSNV